MDPAEKGDRAAATLRQEACVLVANARVLPAIANQHGVLGERRIGGGHQVRRSLGVVERRGAIGDGGHRERLYMPMIVGTIPASVISMMPTEGASCRLRCRATCSQ